MVHAQKDTAGPGARVPGSARRAMLAVLIALAMITGCGQTAEPDPSRSPATDDPASGAPTGPQDPDRDGADPAPDPSPTGSGSGDSGSGSDDPGTDPSATPGGPATAQPAPGGGDIYTEVAVPEQDYLPAVDVQTATQVDDIARVEVVALNRAEVEARTAGEISGPGIIVTAVIRNESDADLDLALVTVNAEDAAGLPLTPMSGPPADPFFGPLAPGSKAEATYVFGLPQGAVGPFTVTINPAPDAAVAVFGGDAF